MKSILRSKRRKLALEGTWGRATATERGRVLMRIGEKVLDNTEELASLKRATRVSR